jgi:sensor histidine kinase YesM
MFKAVYKRNQYFFNLLIVLVLLTTTRILDWFVWQSPFPGKTKYILLTHLFEFISCLPILLLLISSYLWAIKRKHPILLVILIIAFAISGQALLKLLTTFFEIILWKKGVQPITFEYIKKFIPIGVVYFLSLSAAFYITRIRLQFIQQREATFKAETLAKDVQLKMLRYQINPHFLFNVLNSIHALIDENKEKAKKLIVEMSEYYRYTLNKQEQTTSIEKEVEAIRKYLEILKIRFEEKFEYDISVDKAINSVLIPSFVIHLLIENAVKYGLQTNEQKLVIIGLKAKKSNNTLSINVSNSGKLLTSDNHTDNNINGTGNGIENIKNRLALFYKENYSFSLTEENGWVIATIEIKDIAS